MHMIDETTGKAAIAYAGQTPWHGLGQQLTPDQDLATWQREAGLDFTVKESMVEFATEDGMESYPERKVLYRSDTKGRLSVMGRDFHPVQPADLLKLYSEIAKAAGFSLETAGALDGGRRIWALAKVSEGADVVNNDRVRPYLLLATSFDGSAATTAKYVAERVVCHNTITMALNESASEVAGQEQLVRVLHATKWTEEVERDVRLKLGVAHDAFERWLIGTRALASRSLNSVEADEFLKMLMSPYQNKDAVTPIDETRGYKRVMELFKGAAIGSELVGTSRWAMLNAVTEFVDHERGRSNASRLESAWFGTGNQIKSRAKVLLEAA